MFYTLIIMIILTLIRSFFMPCWLKCRFVMHVAFKCVEDLSIKSRFFLFTTVSWSNVRFIYWSVARSCCSARTWGSLSPSCTASHMSRLAFTPWRFCCFASRRTHRKPKAADTPCPSSGSQSPTPQDMVGGEPNPIKRSGTKFQACNFIPKRMFA